MKSAQSANARTTSRGWQSMLLAAAVCGLGLAHQRATATGVFRDGGAWDKTTVALAQWREQFAARRAAVLERRTLERQTVVRDDDSHQRFNRWQMPPHCDQYPEWEIVWDDRCDPPRQCGPWYPAAAPRHCGPWDHGW